MLSPAGLLIVSDTLNVCYQLYPDIANPKEITSFNFDYVVRIQNTK